LHDASVVLCHLLANSRMDLGFFKNVSGHGCGSADEMVAV
jgi:hypothetical protein